MVAVIELLLDNDLVNYGYSCMAPVTQKVRSEHAVCLWQNIAGPMLSYSVSHRSSPNWIPSLACMDF